MDDEGDERTDLTERPGLGTGDRWFARIAVIATIIGVGVGLWQAITANQNAVTANERATEAIEQSTRPLLVDMRAPSDARVVTPETLPGTCRYRYSVCIVRGYDPGPGHFPLELLSVPVRNIGAGAARVRDVWLTYGGRPIKASSPAPLVASREYARFDFPLNETEADGSGPMLQGGATVGIEYTAVAGRQRQTTTIRMRQSLVVSGVEVHEVGDEQES